MIRTPPPPRARPARLCRRPARLCRRTAGWLLLVLSIAAAAGASRANESPPPAAHAPLEANCFDCHGEYLEEGGLRLDDKPWGVDRAEFWDKVRTRVAKGEMPPAEMGPLPAGDKLELLGAIERLLDEARAAAPGGTRLRRLTKTQYQHSLATLLDVPPELAADLPDDAKSPLGLKGSIAAQQTSPLHVAYYERIAREALSRAIVVGPRPDGLRVRVVLGENRSDDTDPATGAAEIDGYQAAPIAREDFRVELLDADGRPATDRASLAELARVRPDVGIGMRGSSPERYRVVGDGVELDAALPHREVSPHSWRGPSPNLKLLLRRLATPEGPFAIRVRVRSTGDPSGEDRQPYLRAFVGSRTDDGMEYGTVGESTPVATPADESREYLFVGDFASVPAPIVDPNDFDPLSGILIVGVWNDHLVKDPDDPGPRLLVESIEFEAPYHPQWPPASHERLLFDSPLRQQDPRAYAAEVIRRFAERAFRRPVDAAEAERYVEYFDAVRGDYDTLEGALREALVAVLCSPNFLYVDRPEAAPHAEQAPHAEHAEHALASRLAYFLWDGPPDDELLALASEGRLSESLQQQIDRLVQDPRADHFVRNFATQWLRLDRHESMSTDVRRFPDYTRFVKADQTEETVRYFAELLRAARTVDDLVDPSAGAAVLNQNLAEFYGVSGVRGNHFRLVTGARPGGLLAQGAMLNGHSDGAQPHAIKRAVWLRERLLGDPPPPPPPNVPELAKAGEHGAPDSLKERLEQHRDNPSCMACHEAIDPYGFVFEGLDAVGRPRQTDAAGAPIDDRTTLPDGAVVDGVDGLSRYLLAHRRDDLIRALATYLFAYATGKEVTFRERPEIDRIVAAAQPRGRLITIVQGVVASPSFSGAAPGGEPASPRQARAPRRQSDPRPAEAPRPPR
ncbi:DUF1592 domain-containing protein [Botrimarina sp.]|uniref:DUF1592 domain-containing protein n=1 Tax=Botrimarina sp. TaxID=2795802 RepID=UPI0032EBC0FF